MLFQKSESASTVHKFLSLNTKVCCFKCRMVFTDISLSLGTLFIIKFDKMFVLPVGGADWTEPV